MGCGSSSQGDDEFPDAKNTANKQRRKLSVAPGMVGDISQKNAQGGTGPAEEVENVELSELETQAKGQMNHSILSRKGFVPYSKKKVNQDRPVIKYAVGGKVDISMFGVMDGHGEFGHLVSQFVKETLPVYLGKNIDEVVATPEAGIQRAVADMCAELKKTQVDCAFSGTTCVFGVRIGDKMHVANIGDSRCVMFQKDAAGNIKCKDLSEDHKPESPGEKERILAAGGRVKTLPGPPGEDCGPMRVWLADVEVPGLAMSRSIGDEVSQTVGVISVPEVRVHDITSEDMFCVFASDGVWEFIESFDAVKMVWDNRTDLTLAAKVLVDESTRRWKHEEEVIDDITCTIIQFNSFD